MTQAERDAQAEAQREAERQARISSITEKLKTAEENKSNYERYAMAADDAKLAIGRAAGGAAFINSGQKKSVSTKLESAIYPKESLMELLDFEDTSIETTLTTAEIDIETLAKDLWDKYAVYSAEVEQLNNELLSIL